MEIRRYRLSESALVVELDGPAAARWRSLPPLSSGEVVPCRNLLAFYDVSDAEVDRLLQESEAVSVPPATHSIPVCFEMGLDDIPNAELLLAAELVVEMIGFSPGFGYLSGLPEELSRVPRRASPRPLVPAGSVAVAAGYAGIYPDATPGGWNIVGRTPMKMVDLGADFFRLKVGDQVRFFRITVEQFANWSES